MSPVLSKTTPNAYIATLDFVLSEATHPIECLVVAHNDPKMLAALRTALANEGAVILEVSQDIWDLDGKQLSEAVEWMLEKTDLKQLVLVGHSLAGGPQSRASLAASASKNGGEDGYKKLLNGVYLNNTRNHAAQERLAMQVQRMSRIPCVASRYTAGELSVHGLLYRVESGVFLAYDTNHDEFRPLVA